jgi:Helix-turn-helix domain
MKYEDLITRDKWYSVWELSKTLEVSQDSIRRWIHRGFLKALIFPSVLGRRKRLYRAVRVLGAEVIRFLERYSTSLK